jgi:hypothetical protein
VNRQHRHPPGQHVTVGQILRMAHPYMFTPPCEPPALTVYPAGENAASGPAPG